MTERAAEGLRATLDSGGFAWLAGIEDTFITAPNGRTGRTLDEYELTDHYRRWRTDLELFHELGVRAVRYGLPWHRINPARNRWDFDWAERVVDRLLELGIEPIVDLVHYGVPTWIEGAFAGTDYPKYVEEYAVAVAEKFRGRIEAFTPLNEPRITAWYTGMLGWWPPHRRGWKGFVRVMLGVCRGVVRTVRAVGTASPGARIVHVDACDLYVSGDDSTAAAAEFRQQVGFLALDLVSGRVNDQHPLWRWLLAQGAAEHELVEFAEGPLDLDVIGLNLYPMFSRKVLTRRDGRLRVRSPYADASIVRDLSALYHRRYRRPLLITETASDGSVLRRAAWLDASVAAVRAVRAEGIPLLGYTWWPLFALVAWAYREGTLPVAAYVRQMGLFDLHVDSGAPLDRLRTELVGRYRTLALAGAEAVGPLGRGGELGAS